MFPTWRRSPGRRGWPPGARRWPRPRRRRSSYTDPRGLPQLRDALAGYLARARGVAVTPDRVVVCAGFAQGLELLCEALRARGATTLAAEALGYPRHWRIAEKSGLAVTAVPVDESGAVIGDLDRADALLLTPTHQFPLGVPLAPARRRQAADWASSAGRGDRGRRLRRRTAL